MFLFSMHLLTNGHVSVFTTLRNMKVLVSQMEKDVSGVGEG